VDDAAGNRFYQYDMEQAKAGLLKKALSEINKYSLKQLEAHAIETDTKKKNAALKLLERKA
jgi:hypothetical protein